MNSFGGVVLLGRRVETGFEGSNVRQMESTGGSELKCQNDIKTETEKLGQGGRSGGQSDKITLSSWPFVIFSSYQRDK